MKKSWLPVQQEITQQAFSWLKRVGNRVIDNVTIEDVVHITDPQYLQQRAMSVMQTVVVEEAKEAIMDSVRGALENSHKEKKTLTEQLHGIMPLTQLIPTMTSILEDPTTSASVFLTTVYAAKSDFLYQRLVYEFKSAFIACEALSNGSVNRKETTAEQMVKIGTTAVRATAGLMPVVGSVIGETVSALLTHGVKAYHAEESKKRVTRIKALYANMDRAKGTELGAIDTLSNGWSGILAYQLKTAIRSLTEEGITTLATVIAGKTIDAVVGIDEKSRDAVDLTFILRALRQREDSNTYAATLAHLMGFDPTHQKLPCDPPSSGILAKDLLNELDPYASIQSQRIKEMPKLSFI